MSYETPARAYPAVPAPRDSAPEGSGVWSTRGPVRIFFETTPRAGYCTLVVTSPAQWPVAAHVYRRLFDNRVQVIHVEVKKVEQDSRLEHRLRLVEFDGAPLLPHRRRTIAEQLVDLLEEFGVEYQSSIGMAKPSA